MSKEENYWLQSLRKDLKSGGEITTLIEKYEKKKRSNLYQAVMEVTFLDYVEAGRANTPQEMVNLFEQDIRYQEMMDVHRKLESEIQDLQYQVANIYIPSSYN